MLEIAPDGFEELDDEGFVELAVYTDDAGEALVRTRFRDVSAALVAPGWEDAWRAFHRPVRAGGIWIGPPWEVPPPGEHAVVVDPGRAFGTGAHPTTRACLELLAGLERGSVLDAGCGSGVVAVAAAVLGFQPVWAVDSDPVAVEVARETAHRNDVRLELSVADVVEDGLPHVDVVVANIELGTVEKLLGRRPAAVAVTSGYLAGEAPRALGWVSDTRLELDGWAADVLRAT